MNYEYQDMMNLISCYEEITILDELELESQIQIYQDHEEYIFNEAYQ